MYNEKDSEVPTAITTSIQQLRMDVENNATILAQYEETFRNQSYVPNDVGQSYSMRTAIEFIAKAPANVLRKLRKHLVKVIERLLLMINQGMWLVPRLLIGDVIRFEDALGRRAHLPYPYFRQWTLFKEFLVHTFKGLPGEYQINRDQYCVTTGKRRRYINAKNWQNVVRPGGLVSMSIVSPRSPKMNKPFMCPRCGYNLHRDNTLADFFMCRNCNNKFEIHETSPQISIRASDGLHNKFSLLAAKGHAMFLKSRLPSGPLKPEDEHGSNPYIKHTIRDESENTTRVNAGLSQLKHLIIHYTNNPLEIADAIETLLDQLLTTFPNSGIICDRKINELRTALSLVRNEATRTHELNYFDIRTEHSLFTTHSSALTSSLESHLIPTGRNFSNDLPHSITNLTSWISSHYPSGFTSLLTTIPAQRDTLVLAKTLLNQIICFRCSVSTTIMQLKEAIRRREGLPCHQQYLVCRGRKLEERSTVEECELGPTVYVHILLPIWRAVG